MREWKNSLLLIFGFSAIAATISVFLCIVTFLPSKVEHFETKADLKVS